MSSPAYILIAYCVFLPAGVLALERRFSIVRTIGAVLICCALGIAVANQPFVVVDAELQEQIDKATNLVNMITIPLAIPLLLFQSDMTELKSQGRAAISGFFISAASVFIGVTAMRYAFGDLLGAEGGKAAGMVMSVYIGGTPNLVAVQTAVEASKETFGVVFAATTFISTFYLFFVLGPAKLLLGRFYPAHPMADSDTSEIDLEATTEPTPLTEKLKNGSISILAAGVCVGISVVVAGQLVDGEFRSLAIILGLTTLAIIGSFWKTLREHPTHEPIGAYLILAFCISAGIKMDIVKLVSSGTTFLAFTTCSVLLFLVIHYALNRLVGNDIDTTITMSMATMFGPPFIPPVAKALRNNAVLVPGMTLGFLGYALGTYLGIFAGSWL